MAEKASRPHLGSTTLPIVLRRSADFLSGFSHNQSSRGTLPSTFHSSWASLSAPSAVKMPWAFQALLTGSDLKQALKMERSRPGLYASKNVRSRHTSLPKTKRHRAVCPLSPLRGHQHCGRTPWPIARPCHASGKTPAARLKLNAESLPEQGSCEGPCASPTKCGTRSRGWPIASAKLNPPTLSDQVAFFLRPARETLPQ